MVRLNALRHGHTRGGRVSPEYNSWAGMIQRVSNPRNPNYPRYGGRGITVDDRWRQFDNFVEDMGVKPGPGYSLERIDNEGPYTPLNCKWATCKEQNANKRLYKLERRHLRQIQFLVELGYSKAAVARMYGVRPRCVVLIVNGEYASQKKERHGESV